MNITKELAERIIRVTDLLERDTPFNKIVMKWEVVGERLPNKKQWFKKYQVEAKSLKIKGPNPTKAAKILTPSLLVPEYELKKDLLMEEAYNEAIRRGLTRQLDKNHWVRKIAEGHMAEENNMI